MRLSAILLTFTPSLVLAGGGFSGSCIDLDFSGTTLIANCYNDGGSLVSNLLNMNTCLTNSNGQLLWQAKYVFIFWLISLLSFLPSPFVSGQEVVANDGDDIVEDIQAAVHHVISKLRQQSLCVIATIPLEVWVLRGRISVCLIFCQANE